MPAEPLYLGPNADAPIPYGAGTGANVIVTGNNFGVTNNFRTADTTELESTDGGLYYALSDRTAPTLAIGGIWGDRIETGSGDDTIDGGTGNDTLVGGDGKDGSKPSAPHSTPRTSSSSAKNRAAARMTSSGQLVRRDSLLVMS